MIDLNLEGEIDPNLFRHLIEMQASIEEIGRSLAAAVIERKLTILKLVELLDCAITCEELSIRHGGIDILTIVLTELPADYLSEAEVLNFINFYCARIVDHHSLLPLVLRGLLALVRMNHLPDGAAAKIFVQMNLHFNCQSQPVADRHICYLLLQTMIEKKPAELQALGPDFVEGYLSIFDGERDPRNLMLLFQNLPHFFKNFPLGHLVEDAFEAASCYFPIDFRSNPKGPKGITRDDLAASLLPCLTANETFQAFAIELGIEKFSSDLEIAKLESLILFTRCYDDFPPDSICSSWSDVVSVLINEMKPGKKSFELQEKCADVIAHILKHLSNHNKFEIMEDVLVYVYTNLEIFINDVYLSFFFPTVKLLARISTACSMACQFLAPRVLQKLFYFHLESKSHILMALESLNLLLSPCVTFEVSCADVFTSLWNPITELLVECYQNSDKQILMKAFSITTKLVSLLSPAEKQSFYLHLMKRIGTEVDNDVWKTCAECLRQLAVVNPDEVKKCVDSTIINFRQRAGSDVKHEERIFELCCVLAPERGFDSYLDVAVRYYLQNSSNAFMKFVIDRLKNLIVREKTNVTFLNTLHNDLQLTDYFLRWWHAGNIALSEVGSIFDDEQAASNITCIITIVVRALERKIQMHLAVDFFKLMIGCSQRFMSSVYYVDPSGDLNSPDLHCSLSIVSFEAILNGIHAEILTETLDQALPQIVKYLVTVAKYCSRHFCCLIACRCLATITNKFLEDSSCLARIEFLLESARSVLKKDSISLKINAMNILFYLAKSLVYRNHPNAYCCFDMIFAEICDPDIHLTVREGFYNLSLEDEYFLNVSSHFVVQPGYYERLFSFSVPKLLEFFLHDDKSLKHTCALSVVCLLVRTPLTVFQESVREIIPLFTTVLVEAVPKDIVIPALTKINAILEDNPSTFEEYVETFLSKLLYLARKAELDVRIAALQSLSNFTKLNPAVILPFKDKVTRDLSYCVDDRKRLVRQQAVRTRSKWYVLGVM